MKLQEYIEEKKKLLKESPEKAFNDLIEQIKHTYQKINSLEKTNKKKIYDLFTLFDIGKEISSSLDISNIIQQVMFTSRAQMKAKQVHLLIKSEDEEILVIKKSTAVKTPEEKEKFIFNINDEFIRLLQESRKPCFIKDIENKMDPKVKTKFNQLNAMLLVPLIAKENLIGILILGPKIKDEYSEDNLSFLSVLANFTAAAVENAQLYTKVNHNLSLISGLYEISGIMNSAVSLEEISKMVIETITTGFNVDMCAIILVNHTTGKLEIKAQSGLSDDSVNNYHVDVDTDSLESINESSFITDVSKNKGIKMFSQEDQAMISYLFQIPLRAGEKFIGFLDIYRFKDEKVKQDEKKNVFTIISSQVAPALLMAQMIDEKKESVINPFLSIKQVLENEINRAKEFDQGFVLLDVRFDNIAEYLAKQKITDYDDFFFNLETLLKINLRENDKIIRTCFSSYLIVLPLTLISDAEEVTKNFDFKNFDSVKEYMNIKTIAYPDNAQDINSLLVLL